MHDLGQRTVEINHKNNAKGCERCLSPQLAQRKNEKHKQGEIRDRLGPSDREEKPCAVLRRPNHSAERRIFIHQSHTREFGRCDKAETLHAEDPRTRLRIQEGGLARGRCNQKQRTPSCVLYPRETRWIGIPIQYSRLSSTSSLTATRSTLQIWSVRKKKISSSSRLPTVASSASTLGHTTVRSSTGCARERQFSMKTKRQIRQDVLSRVVANRNSLVPRFVVAAQKQRNLTEDQKRTAQATLRGQLRQHQGLASTRDRSSTFGRKPHTATDADHQLHRKIQRTLEERRTQGAKLDAAGTHIKFLLKHRPVGSPPGRARRDVVLRDNIAVNEDMSNDPRYNRTENQNSDTTERINDREFRQIWTSHTGDKASTIFAGITTHQGTASRSGELVARKDKRRGTQSSEEEERERRRANEHERSGGSGETNHQLHPPKVSGRGTPGSGKEKANGASLSTCLSCDVQRPEKLAS